MYTLDGLIGRSCNEFGSNRLMSNDQQSSLERLRELRNLWATWVYFFLSSALRPLSVHKGAAAYTFVLLFSVFLMQAIRSGYSYTATASLLFSPPPFQTVGLGAELMPEPLDMPSYSKLIRDGAIMKRVADQLVEEKPELWTELKENGALAPSVLQRMVTVTTEVAEKTPQRVSYARALYLSASAGTPERAEHLARTWAEVAVEAARTFTLPSAAATIEYVRTEYDAAKVDLEEKDDMLRAEKVQFDVEKMKAVKEELAKVLAEQKKDLSLAVVQAEDARKQLEEVRTLLTTEPHMLEVRRAPSVDALAEIGAEGGKNVPVYKEEVQNNAYAPLKAKEAEAAQLLSGSEARVAALQSEISKMETELSALNEAYVTSDIKQNQLLREITAGEDYLKAMAKQRGEIALLEAATKMEQAKAIFIANEPVLPSEPDNELMRWAGLPVGAIVALIAAVAVANILYEVNRVKKLVGESAAPAESA